MNFKDILNKFSVLSEAEETKARKVAGRAYGGAAQHDDDDDENDDKPKKAAAPEKKGRGRPRKDAGNDSPKYAGAIELQGWIVGNKPKKSKELENLPKRTNKLKEAEQVQVVPAKQDTQLIKQGDKTLGAVTNPQLAAQIKSSLGKGEMTLAGDEKLGETKKKVAEKAVSKKQQKFMGMVHAAQKGEKPASKKVADVAKTMKKGDVKDFASTKHKGLPEKKKSSESKGSKPDFLDMDKDGNKKEPMKKAVADRKTSKLKESKMAQLDDDLKNMSNAAFKEEYGCTKAEMRQNMAEKNPGQKKSFPIKESISLRENASAMELIISQYKHEVKNFINGGDLDDDLYHTLYDYYFDIGEMPRGVAKARSGDPYEWVSARFDQDVHDYVDTEELDEGRPRRQPGLNPRDPEWIDYDEEEEEEPYNTDDDMYDAYSDYSPDTDYERMNEDPDDYEVPAVWRKHREQGAKGKFPASLDDVLGADRPRGTGPKSHETPAVWRKHREQDAKGKFPASLDDVLGPGDNLSDLRNLQRRNRDLDEDPFGMGGMKDAQFESWDRELNNLLNEGLTVSFNSGQETTPDSVSINATEEDATQLLALMKNSGLGVFSKEEESHEPQGFSSSLLSIQPQDREVETPTVIDDSDDMISIIKKLSGSSDHGHDHGFKDNEEMVDEEKNGVCPDCGMSDCECEDHLEEEHTTCNECGMMENECECDEEPVEEAFQNEVDTETQDTEYMVNDISGGLNGQKSSRAAGDIKKVEVSENIVDWKKLAGIK